MRERETHKFSFSPGRDVTVYTLEAVKNSVCGIVLYDEKLDGKSFTPRERKRQQHEQNLHRGRLC